MPPRKIAPNPKSNTNPNPNPDRGQFSSGAIVWLTPKLKTNPNLDLNPNPNRGEIVWIPNLNEVVACVANYFIENCFIQISSFECNLSFATPVNRIISIVLDRVLVNFMIADDLFVKLVWCFHGDSEMKSSTLNLRFRIIYFVT